MDDLCFRVQIIRDMAFVYEPVAMDGPSTSVLFDWGSPADNQDTATYIQTTIPGNGIFHTFILPSKKVCQDTFGSTSVLMSTTRRAKLCGTTLVLMYGQLYLNCPFGSRRVTRYVRVRSTS